MRIAYILYFIFAVNQVNGQFFYFEDPDHVFETSAFSFEWRDLDLQEVEMFMSKNELFYLNTLKKGAKTIIRCEKKGTVISHFFEFEFDKGSIVGMKKSIGYPVPNMVYMTDALDSEIFAQTKLLAKQHDETVFSIFSESYYKFMRRQNDLFKIVDTNQTEIQYSNFYKEGDYFVFRNASIKKAGVAFEIYLNEEITLPNENYFISGSNLQSFNTLDIIGMVNKFVDDAKLNGLNFKVGEISIEFADLEENTLGLSKGIYDDNIVKVLIDKDNWYGSSPAHRWYVIYHELGHDILNFEHGDGGRMMDPISDFGYSWSEFWADRQDMFFKYLIR